MSQRVILYIGTDFFLIVNVTGDIDLPAATAATFILRKNGVEDIVFTMAEENISIEGMTMTIHIDDGVVTVPGMYEIRITATVGGHILPIETTPSTLTAR